MINISYYTLPLVHLQTLGASIRFATRRLGFRNNVNPRQVLDDMEKSGKVKPKTLEKLKRRQAAHENCFENEAIFIGAVVSAPFETVSRQTTLNHSLLQIAGNQVGLSTKYMNIMSVSYFLLRCIYSIYIYSSITASYMMLTLLL